MSKRDDEVVALLGAGGTMGAGMARNLLRAGFGVRAWNRTAEKATPLERDGAELAGSPAEAASGAGIVLTMLSDADAVIAAMDGRHGALAGAGSGALWVQASTVGEDGTARCADLARERGIAFFDAPVLGTKAPAGEGKLVILASGPADGAARERLDPLFKAIGQRTLWLGEAGEGTRLKLATNAWVLTVVEGTAEVVAMAEGFGLDPRLVLRALEGGPLDLPYLRTKAQAILDEDYEPSFKLALAAKDARLMLEAAQAHGMRLPLVQTIAEQLARGAEEHPGEDMIATYLTSAPGRQHAPS